MAGFYLSRNGCWLLPSNTYSPTSGSLWGSSVLRQRYLKCRGCPFGSGQAFLGIAFVSDMRSCSRWPDAACLPAMWQSGAEQPFCSGSILLFFLLLWSCCSPLPSFLSFSLVPFCYCYACPFKLACYLTQPSSPACFALTLCLPMRIVQCNSEGSWSLKSQRWPRRGSPGLPQQEQTGSWFLREPLHSPWAAVSPG